MDESIESSPLYAVISFFVVWTEFIVRTYIRVKAVLDAVMFVAQKKPGKPTRSTYTSEINNNNNNNKYYRSTTIMKSPSINVLPNEVLQLIFKNESKSDLYNYTLVCQRWHRVVTPILWKDPILPRSSVIYQQFNNNSSHDIQQYDSDMVALPMIILALQYKKYGYSVRSLHLSSIAHLITDDVLLYIIKSCPRLKSLDISNCQQITSKGYQYLARSKFASSLTQLCLSGCPQLSDSALVALSMRCESLESIHLAGCHRITQTGVRSLIAASRHKLKYINIKDCIRVSGRILQDIAVMCGSRLRGLDVTRICSILHHDMKVLVYHCPNIEQLYLGKNKSQFLQQSSSTHSDKLKQRTHRSRHLSQPIWNLDQIKNNNNSKTSIHQQQQYEEDNNDEEDEVSQLTVDMILKNLLNLKKVDFSYWTCLSEQGIRRLRQKGHTLQYIGLDGCSSVTQLPISSHKSGISDICKN
ncbi:hypothetical protein BJ944DRAFT_201519 [Cunninghamella echinulata]|nr:hypothetical protein BJ944DRAFT_201519 [Cunninghamella echinulata]